MASYSISSYTESSVTIRATGLTTGYTVRFFIRLESDSSDTTVDESYTATSSTMTKTFYGLDSGTYYIVNVQYGTWDTSFTWLGAEYFTTDKESVPPPDYWSWTSSNGEATTVMTRNAYTAVTSNGYTTDFSYYVWNDMCAKVLEVREYAGYSWSSNYASYSATRMTSSDKEITATRFNSLRFNIGALYSTGISEVSKGDIIYGSYFTTLMSKLNSLIDTL